MLWLDRNLGILTDCERRELACDFAERVLPIYEKANPGDDRPRIAIETARKYARGEATLEELNAAYAAAYAAADAAADAADAAADAAAYAAAYAAERKWQAGRIREVCPSIATRMKEAAR